MKDIRRAAVVGAGVMGHGIAFVMARASIDVTVIDQSSIALKNAHYQIEELIESGKQRKSLGEHEGTLIRNHLRFDTDLASIIGVDIMIEAASEDLETKRHIFHEASTLLSQDALLATNTSSLAIKEIVWGIKNPDRSLGLHFFNPPHIMKLLEIVRHDETSDETIEQAHGLSRRLEKECIVVHDSPGFATSRLGISFALEAIRMVEQRVAGVFDIDAAMKLGYGHPMGPLMLSDWVGLDIRLAISEHLYGALESKVFMPPELLRRMVRARLLGRKSGTGFYEWDKGRSLGVSPVFLDLLAGF